jgi:hypothetical protein
MAGRVYLRRHFSPLVYFCQEARYNGYRKRNFRGSRFAESNWQNHQLLWRINVLRS